MLVTIPLVYLFSSFSSLRNINRREFTFPQRLSGKQTRSKTKKELYFHKNNLYRERESRAKALLGWPVTCRLWAWRGPGRGEAASEERGGGRAGGRVERTAVRIEGGDWLEWTATVGLRPSKYPASEWGVGAEVTQVEISPQKR